jgi:arsenite methyltransferase
MQTALQEKAPDIRQAIERYRAHAQGYDASAARTMPLRRRTIAALALEAGDAVLDVACGTGLSFALIVAAIGDRGRLTGVELSPDMARLARERIAKAGWENVTLIESAIEDAALDGPFDLFNFTHDVCAARSPGLRHSVNAMSRTIAPGSRMLPTLRER